MSNDIHKAFSQQSKHQWVVRKTNATERIQKLQRLKSVIEAHAGAVTAALHADLRKPAPEEELLATYGEIDGTVSNLAKWMGGPHEVELSPDFADMSKSARVIYEPRGIVLLFGPWNYPFALIFMPLVSIIAAGNCALVKTNEMSPQISSVVATIIREAFNPKDVTVFEGGVDLANELLELPVDHVFFTGSPAVGKVVMQAAAKNLASVTLELGGKNPVLVDRDADIADAASKLAVMRMQNSGQNCLCPENIWVHEECANEFLSKVKEMFQTTFYNDDGKKLNTEKVGKIINRRNLGRIKGYLDDAKERGAKVVCGGDVIEESMSVLPTILTQVPDDARIMSEEVFGPILIVLTYRTIDEVYQTLHQQPKPLALYIFTQKDEFVDDVLANTTSGGVTVNNCMYHCAERNLPFGGVGKSGMGRYHGIHGFKELSHERSVMHMK